MAKIKDLRSLSVDELEAKLRGMGLNVRPKKKTLTPEELQAEVMGKEKEATPD